MLELTPDFIKEYEIYLSTDAGLHNAQRVVKLYVVENNRGEGPLQRADTENPVCPVPRQPERQGTGIFDRR